MGLFNKRLEKFDPRWDDLKNSKEDDEELCHVIDEFFKIDSLSLDQVLANFDAAANFRVYGRLTIPSILEENLNETKPSPSLEFALKPLNRGAIFPDWFCTAYPDVVKWMGSSKSVNNLFDKNIDPSDPKNHKYIFRTLINAYKKLGVKLECQ